jgi:hypothetical protein
VWLELSAMTPFQEKTTKPRIYAAMSKSSAIPLLFRINALKKMFDHNPIPISLHTLLVLLHQACNILFSSPIL